MWVTIKNKNTTLYKTLFSLNIPHQATYIGNKGSKNLEKDIKWSVRAEKRPKTISKTYSSFKRYLRPSVSAKTNNKNIILSYTKLPGPKYFKA